MFMRFVSVVVVFINDTDFLLVGVAHECKHKLFRTTLN